MKLVKADPRNLRKRCGAATIAVKEFLNSDLECVECFFDKTEYTTSRKAYNNIHAVISFYKYPCYAKCRKDRIFLFKA